MRFESIPASLYPNHGILWQPPSPPVVYVIHQDGQTMRQVSLMGINRHRMLGNGK